MTTGSQAEFARKYGYSKAAVTQFKKADRLVFISAGVLDFEASRKKIFDTSNPSRNDVSRRHAEYRGEDETEKPERSGNAFHNAKTVREKYLALQAKLDYEVNSGMYVEKAQVEKIVFERARQFRDGLLTCSRRIAPEISGREDVKQIEDILYKEFRLILEQFSKLPVVE